MDNPELIEQLKRAQTLGFLGPVPVQDHVAHSAGFLEALEELEHGRVADLGSGPALMTQWRTLPDILGDGEITELQELFTEALSDLVEELR